MRYLLLTLLFITSLYLAEAQNPIVPPGVYIADPEAKVFKDGRLYIYGSRDESDDYWCSYQYHILSTNNLKKWKLDENVFSTRGHRDAVKGTDDLLFAPDCIERNGIYYLYYCTPDGSHTEGVATSKNPLGPFVDGKKISGTYEIDPAAFVDSDGKGYYWWGQHSPKVARLAPDLLSIDTSTIREPLLPTKVKTFHEGSSIRKIGNLYYLVFADESRRGRPTCLGYAISKSPLGPFEYKGVIIDNYGSDPAVWNNHGSIHQYNGKWYVFYHRSTHNSQKFRKTCIESISISKDGTIKEVEMTSQGAGTALNAFEPIDAAASCLMNGNVRISKLPSTDIPNEGLTQIKNGDWAAFKYISFGNGARSFQIKTNGLGNGIVEIVLDNPNGTVVGKCSLNTVDNQSNFSINTSTIKLTAGRHAVYLRFKTDGQQVPDIDWFSFK